MFGSEPRPRLIVIAGPLGAGKSRVWEELAEDLALADLPVVDFDDTLRHVLHRHGNRPPGDIESAAIDATDAPLGLWRRLDDRTSVVWETPLLSPTAFVNTLILADKLGFKPELFFVGVSNPATILGRVADRARHGGLDIPTHLLRNTFDLNFRALDAATKMVSSGAIYDNRNEVLVTIAGIRAGETFIYRGGWAPWLDKTYLKPEFVDPDRFHNMLGHLDRNPSIRSMGKPRPPSDTNPDPAPTPNPRGQRPGATDPIEDPTQEPTTTLDPAANPDTPEPDTPGPDNDPPKFSTFEPSDTPPQSVRHPRRRGFSM